MAGSVPVRKTPTVRAGRKHPRNSLNDLTGTEWIKFTRSWFVLNPPRRTDEEALHPAKFPEGLAESFIAFFTKPGQNVLDPFAGTGSALVAAQGLGRKGFGVELSPRWAATARRRLGALPGANGETERSLAVDDAREVQRIAEARDWPRMDFCLTSPPYGNILRTSRGGVESVHRKRAKAGMPVHYSDDARDLGNAEGPASYLDGLVEVFQGVQAVLRKGAYLVVVLQNYRAPDGAMEPIAWDLALRLRGLYRLKQERIWCQDNKPLGIWGYPSEYVSNVHHHYCLVFQNP